MKLLHSLTLISAFQQGLVFAASYSAEEVQQRKAQGLRLLAVDGDNQPAWRSEAEKLGLIRQHVHFADITAVYMPGESWPPPQYAKRTRDVATYDAPSHQTQVKSLFPQLSIDSMKNNLNALSSFHNRYYQFQNGVEAGQWVFDTVKNLTSGKAGLSVEAVNHTESPQISVILKFTTEHDGPITILGAHLDSIDDVDPEFGRAPGYDDDGTGTVNLMEVARVLINSSYAPKTPLEFHWYAGEEGGLVGSGEVAASYKAAGKDVKAMLQLDMTGYTQPGDPEVISMPPNNGKNDALNAFVKELAAEYCDIPTTDDGCNGGCSDHFSWEWNGYPVTFPFEAPYISDRYNLWIHSPNDTESVNGFSWSHSLQFTKLALAYAVELTA